jgi:adenine-specific DNA methylase
MGAQLMAIVAESQRGGIYLPPTPEHEVVAASAAPDWTPATALPEQALGFRVQGYGMTKHADLFTFRQLEDKRMITLLCLLCLFAANFLDRRRTADAGWQSSAAV